jgi:hypothetical protein
MSQIFANPSSVRLVQKALGVYAREIGEDPEDAETVMTDFLVSMMALANKQGVDFEAILEEAKSQAGSDF